MKNKAIVVGVTWVLLIAILSFYFSRRLNLGIIWTLGLIVIVFGIFIILAIDWRRV